MTAPIPEGGKPRYIHVEIDDYVECDAPHVSDELVQAIRATHDRFHGTHGPARFCPEDLCRTVAGML